MRVKKTILTAVMLATIGHSLLADDAAKDAYKWPYETNEAYCEDIYWEDEHNCVIPGQIVTQKFCDSIVFEDTKMVCLKALKTQSNTQREKLKKVKQALQEEIASIKRAIKRLNNDLKELEK